MPTFGICLGHQLLGRAIGAKTYKLKFGHRGGNQPVKNLDTGRVEITSQNHGFAVDQKSLEAKGGVVTHLNLNDNTVEGFRHSDAARLQRPVPPRSQPRPARRGVPVRRVHRDDEDEEAADGGAAQGACRRCESGIAASEWTLCAVSAGVRRCAAEGGTLAAGKRSQRPSIWDRRSGPGRNRPS